MTREQFEQNNPEIYVVITHRYLDNPGIYAILANDQGNIIAYKNPDENEKSLGATIWAETCLSIEEAYQAINDYVESLSNDLKPKKLLKNRR